MTKENRKVISSILGNQIKSLRNSQNITISQLAEKIGLDKSTIGLYERARRLPSVSNVKKIAKFFGVEENSLLQLRERTIRDTVRLLGDETPSFIRNEVEMLQNAEKSQLNHHPFEDDLLLKDWYDELVYANREDLHTLRQIWEVIKYKETQKE